MGFPAWKWLALGKVFPLRIRLLLVRVLGSRRWTTDIGRINDRWHTLYVFSKLAVSIVLTWFFIFCLYAASVKVVEVLAQQPLSNDFTDPRDYYMITQGIGIITATALTPLFGLYFSLDILESRRTDRDLKRDFRKMHPQWR
jgi:hypothetical protein